MKHPHNKKRPVPFRITEAGVKALEDQKDAECRQHRLTTGLQPYILTKTWQTPSYKDQPHLSHSTQWLACPICGREIK